MARERTEAWGVGRGVSLVEKKRFPVFGGPSPPPLTPLPLVFSGEGNRTGEEALATMGITRLLMHYQEETEPAGKQDWLEIDLSPVPGGRVRGRPVWLRWDWLRAVLRICDSQ